MPCRNKEIVLVLGAGASHPYGYPLGPQLVANIVTDVPKVHVQALLSKVGVSDSDARGFHDDLVRKDFGSIDHFLEAHPHWADLGKLLIAFELISCEASGSMRGTRTKSGAWYHILADRLLDDRGEFRLNNVGVITFNYDRSFEYFLSGIISARRGCSESEAYQDVINSLGVVHVHGDLGSLDESSPDFRGYATVNNVDALLVAANRILVISEVPDTELGFRDAREMLMDARRVMFLGFGYDSRSMRRLGLSSGDKHALASLSRIELAVCGTAKGMTKQEISQVKHEHFAGLGDIRARDCAMMLRDTPGFG